ncbi:hypothetical protein [Streptosporangium minutum]|uniref:Uncharacterized protein n=1 Tax=Streptosporangium minutum TaxID=569862 RepID=A0A243RXM9_9ACTN|nr:hypothetical protein [Streptosporangium minutum]OUC99962.1 hypothetical protein CA984_00455 [Streptosporangium minutum]
MPGSEDIPELTAKDVGEGLDPHDPGCAGVTMPHGAIGDRVSDRPPIVPIGRTRVRPATSKVSLT